MSEVLQASCAHCGVPFTPVSVKNRFCSVACRGRARVDARREKRRAALRAITKCCAHGPCSKPFTPKTRSDQIYCSDRCAFNAGAKAWRARNPETVQKNLNKRTYGQYKATIRAYYNNRYNEDPEYKFLVITRKRVNDWIARPGHNKTCPTAELVGASWSVVRAHIEAQFRPGMSWDNWAMDGWHLDHIRPCDSFDLSDPEQQKQCFHYTNLQPLWAEENLSKGARWEPVAS